MDNAGKEKSKVVILEDITLDPSNCSFVKPTSGISVQSQIHDGKKFNILHRRNLLKGSEEGNVLNPHQVLQNIQLINAESLPQAPQNAGQKIVVSGTFSKTTDNILEADAPNGLVGSGSFHNVSNDVPIEGKNPRAPRSPIIMRKPILAPGENPEEINIFTKYSGPEWYNLTNNLRTDPIITNNLPKVFHDLPIFGAPKNNDDLNDFQDQLCQEFVGLSDEDYEKQKIFCSPDLLLTGKEMKMTTHRPTQGLLSATLELRAEENGNIRIPQDAKLKILKNLNTRIKLDINNIFARRLKYRGIRLLPLQNQEKPAVSSETPPDLQPGHDTLFRVRLFRPFMFLQPGLRRRLKTADGVQQYRGRHSVFSCDVMILGRQKLVELRDRIVCRNDLDLRLDMSEHPELPSAASSKESFPSNFMFINGTFYVDSRDGCRDLTRCLRAFALERGVGDFPVRDMCQVTIQELNVRLASPEVYVHQGNCEHVFQFAEVRLLGYADPLQAGNYPCHGSSSQNQTLYCNTCAEFSARWIVTGCGRVPFDPAFFCDSCFHSYMYIDGRKVGDFNAYLYKGNEMNMMRPNMDMDGLEEPKALTVPMGEVKIDI